jgi:hypothetical protein
VAGIRKRWHFSASGARRSSECPEVRANNK